MSWLSKAAKPVVNIGKSILGFGSQSGPNNPYGAADFSKLWDTSQFNYLKDLAKTTYDPLKAENNTLFQNYLKGISTTAGTPGEGQFKDYLTAISAPSSVDEVRKGIETEQLQNTLRDIGRQTDQTVGSTKMDFLDRGLGGPGQMSDIEAVALAQARGKGDELANQARLDVYQKELDRQKAKEEAARTAYGARYGVGAEADKGLADTLRTAYGQQYATGTNLGSQEAASTLDLNKYLSDLISGRQVSATTGQAGAYSAAEDAKYKYSKPSVWEDILRNTKINFDFGGGAKA